MAVYSITVLGIPLPLLFLYFLWYSFLGWIMETVYCSIRERRFVFRGFLKGPICPIYGFGVLMMVLWLSKFTQNAFLFYLVATVTMSAWEYLVGWLLEVTTHMKYWDYSDHRFHLKGRICLSTSLFWGVAAYAAIYWIHPATVRLFQLLTPLWQTLLARFRARYRALSSRNFAPSLQQVKEQAARLIGDRAARFAKQKQLRKEQKQANRKK